MLLSAKGHSNKLAVGNEVSVQSNPTVDETTFPDVLRSKRKNGKGKTHRDGKGEKGVQGASERERERDRERITRKIGATRFGFSKP